jgi:hypothetical protein
MLLVALAFSQIVLFVMMVAALIASAAFADGLSGRRAIVMSVTCAFALIVSTRLGGFFAPLPTGTSLPLIPQFGATPTILGSIIWNAASFGVLLPAGLAGLVLAGRWRAMLACLALGGLAVVNLVRYEHSWDIAKFGAVTALGLAIGASIAVNRLLELRPDRLARASAMAIVIAIVTAPALLIFAFATVIPGIPEDAYGRRPAAYTVNEGRSMSWLRRHVQSGELVYRNVGQYHAFTQWAGLSEPRGDPMLERFGVPPSLTERRDRLVTVWPEDPDAFVSEGIIWFVLRDDDSPAVQLTDEWLSRGRAAVRAEFGSLRIVELLSDDTLPLEPAK